MGQTFVRQRAAALTLRELCTVCTLFFAMAKRASYGAEEARACLPELIERAHRGISTVITRHGRPYAAVVPLDRVPRTGARGLLVALAGSGAGLWGRNSAVTTTAALRDEWG